MTLWIAYWLVPAISLDNSDLNIKSHRQQLSVKKKMKKKGNKK